MSADYIAIFVLMMTSCLLLLASISTIRATTDLAKAMTQLAETTCEAERLMQESIHLSGSRKVAPHD